MKRYRSFYIFLVAILSLSACTPATPPPPSIETIVAATYAISKMQTAAAMPTATLFPPTQTKVRATSTPFPTATAFIISSFTPTPTSTATPLPTATNVTSGSGNVLYSCEVVSLSPESGFEVKKNEKFIWTVRVKNIGTVRWNNEETKLAYLSGAEFYKDKRVLLHKSTKVGQIGEFRVKMVAPKEPGKHTSVWTMRKGIHDFCVIKFRIVVKK